MSFIESPASTTSRVDSHAEGRSKEPDGIYHLIGNVWEWTATPLGQTYSADPKWKTPVAGRTDTGLIVLGGAYGADAAAQDWTTEDNPSPPSRAEPWLGFRCVR